MAKPIEHQVEQLKSAVEFAKQAISFGFLLNGGALIALMTFMGGTVDNLATEKLSEIAGSSGWFVAGLIASTLCSIIAYIAQLNYYKRDAELGGQFSDPTSLRIALVVGLVISVALFSFGAIGSFQALAG